MSHSDIYVNGRKLELCARYCEWRTMEHHHCDQAAALRPYADCVVSVTKATDHDDEPIADYKPRWVVGISSYHNSIILCCPYCGVELPS